MRKLNAVQRKLVRQIQEAGIEWRRWYYMGSILNEFLTSSGLIRLGHTMADKNRLNLIEEALLARWENLNEKATKAYSKGQDLMEEAAKHGLPTDESFWLMSKAIDRVKPISRRQKRSLLNQWIQEATRNSENKANRLHRVIRETESDREARILWRYAQSLEKKRKPTQPVRRTPRRLR